MAKVDGANLALERGWAVIAVWGVRPDGSCRCPQAGECKAAGKHPISSRWRSATLQQSNIDNMLAASGDLHNWGILTGPASGVWVLDIDAGSGGLDTLTRLEAEHDKLPDTFTVNTGGGGKHFYFRQPDAFDIRNSAGAIGSGVDVRGDGGFVVLPFSISSKGEYTVGLDVETVEAPAWVYAAMRKRTRKQPEAILEGSRNTTLASIAGSYRRAGATQEQIEQHLLRLNRDNTVGDPLSDDEVIAIAASISRYDPEIASESASDVGNLERFVNTQGDSVRHSLELGWLAWDGKRWLRNEKFVYEKARTVHKMIRNEVLGATDPKQLKALNDWANVSMSRARIESIVAMAEKDPRLDVPHDALDAHPWLFNAANGVIDLKTGALMPHRPDYLLTKLSPTRYVPNAKAPTWEWFLKDIFEGDMGIVRFMQRSAGILLSGDTSEHALWFLYGHGRNGKSVMVETLLRVLGSDYGTEAAIGLLEAKKMEGHTTDIAELRGVRFLTANETQEGKALDEARVKQLTGGDTLKGRHMRQDNMAFSPTHKLWLRGNHKPVIRDLTISIWNRIKLIPFKRIYLDTEQDKDLSNKLAAEAEGILAWMVKGCLEWQRNGLQTPASVVAATQEYREEMDPIGTFLTEICDVSDPQATAVKVDLYSSYTAWASLNNERTIAQRDFTRMLRERGFVEVRTASARSWAGVRIVRSVGAYTKEC